MSPWLLALLTGDSEPVTQTFTANATFTVSAGTTRLEKMVGKGAAGTPASSGTVQRYEVQEYIVLRRRDGTGDFTSPHRLPYYEFGPTPADYCTAEVATPSDPTYSTTRTCYVYSDADYSYNDPATTGASTTGFGKTFPGGTGGAALATTFTNVAVTENTAYQIVVPSGGTLTITYYP